MVTGCAIHVVSDFCCSLCRLVIIQNASCQAKQALVVPVKDLLQRARVSRLQLLK